MRLLRLQLATTCGYLFCFDGQFRQRELLERGLVNGHSQTGTGRYGDRAVVIQDKAFVRDVALVITVGG